MPKGTKVARCVEKVKGKKGVNAYAVCQKATGMSYATGKKLKSHMPPGVEQSPEGDIADHRLAEWKAAFPNAVKGAGSHPSPHTLLPFRREHMVCEYSDHDKVV